MQCIKAHLPPDARSAQFETLYALKSAKKTHFWTYLARLSYLGGGDLYLNLKLSCVKCGWDLSFNIKDAKENEKDKWYMEKKKKEKCKNKRKLKT